MAVLPVAHQAALEYAAAWKLTLCSSVHQHHTQPDMTQASDRASMYSLSTVCQSEGLATQSSMAGPRQQLAFKP